MHESGNPDRPAKREEFKLHHAIRWVVGGAIWLWVMVLVVLFWQPAQIPWKTYLSAVFFILLFSSVLAFYNGLTIVADSDGVIYRGLISFRSYPYESILKIDIRPGVTGIVSYYVVTRRGMLHFSSFIAGHARLAEIIAQRSHLDQEGRRTHPG